jgi:hypothetical protein
MPIWQKDFFSQHEKESDTSASNGVSKPKTLGSSLETEAECGKGKPLLSAWGTTAPLLGCLSRKELEDQEMSGEVGYRN